MEIRLIEETEAKKSIAREILESLPDWFGIAEAREDYIRESAEQNFLCCCDGTKPVGFLCLKETGKSTVEIAVMGVLQQYHRQGVGRSLVNRGKEIAREKGYRFMQVKTVQMGKYADYDATNRFYLSVGFEEFEVFPLLWGEENPCQIYVLGLS